MATRRIAGPGLLLCRYTSLNGRRKCQSMLHQISRSIATVASQSSKPSTPSKYPDASIYNPDKIPKINRVPEAPHQLVQTSTVPTHLKNPDVLVTLYDFPSYQPLQLLHYPATHLHLPLRRDILHRAIVFEGDNERQGTAYSIWRDDHPSSGRKLRPQKGTGRARLGDASPPMLKGGIKAFGPKRRMPGSFATKLPHKIYDLAWRTALSHRYRKGELVVVNSIFKGVMKRMTSIETAKWVEAFNGVGFESPSDLDAPREERKEKIKHGRTLWVIQGGDQKKGEFLDAMRTWYPKDRVKYSNNVDVKMLLEGHRVVMEQDALNEILNKHQRDCVQPVDIEQMREQVEKDAADMQEAVKETKKIEDAMRQAALDAIKANLYPEEINTSSEKLQNINEDVAQEDLQKK